MSSIPVFERLQNEANTKMGMGYLSCFSDKPRPTSNFRMPVINGNEDGSIVDSIRQSKDFDNFVFGSEGFFDYLFNAPPAVLKSLNGFYLSPTDLSMGKDTGFLPRIYKTYKELGDIRSGMDEGVKKKGQVARLLEDDALPLGSTLYDVERMRDDLFSAFAGEKRPPLESWMAALKLDNLDSAKAFYDSVKLLHETNDHNAYLRGFKKLNEALRDGGVYFGRTNDPSVIMDDVEDDRDPSTVRGSLPSNLPDMVASAIAGEELGDEYEGIGQSIFDVTELDPENGRGFQVRR